MCHRIPLSIRKFEWGQLKVPSSILVSIIQFWHGLKEILQKFPFQTCYRKWLGTVRGDQILHNPVMSMWLLPTLLSLQFKFQWCRATMEQHTLFSPQRSIWPWPEFIRPCVFTCPSGILTTFLHLKIGTAFWNVQKTAVFAFTWVIPK